jgi:hypothetical protein
MSDLNWHLVIRLAEDVLMQDLAGEAVLLDLNTEQYYGLDDVGTRMVQVLDQATSVKDAYEQLLAEYEVEPAILQEDLAAFILELRTYGLIREV